MLGRKTSGSVVCPSCGSLVGVNDERCYSCGRANPGMWGFAPALRQFGADFGFVPFVIGASSVMFVASLLLSGGIGMSGTNLLAPSSTALRALGASGSIPVFSDGFWWTVLSATWLHAGLLHILFNMMSLRNIGHDTVEVVGPGRTVIIYVVSGACGFLLSSIMGAAVPLIAQLPLPVPLLRLLVGARLTVGASASIFGLLGALVHYGRKSGSSFIHTQAKQWALIMFLYGLIMPGIDNWAHAGGFLGGYLTSAFFNPLTRERGDHLLVAVALLLVTFAAVALSFVRGLALIS